MRPGRSISVHYGILPTGVSDSRRRPPPECRERLESLDVETFTRYALPLGTGIFLLIALVLPLARPRLGTGTWGITALRNRDPAERRNQLLLLACGTGLGSWCLAYLAWGPEALGVLEVPPAVQWTGWGLAAVSCAWVSLAQAQMGASWRIGIDPRPTPLITTGLFRWVRNPIYSGLLSLLVGFVLVSPALPFLALSLLTGLLLRRQALREAEHLRRLHGRAFSDWASRVGRFLPGIGRLR